jgi:hypothetical protein
MYRLTNKIRYYSSNPVVKVTLDDKGKEVEEIVCICHGKKKESDAMAQKIAAFLNAEEKRTTTDVEDIINHGATSF